MVFDKRLKQAMEGGNLKVADLARWFDRPDPTVRGWVNGVEPAGAPQDKTDIERRLVALETHIRQKKHLPLPPRLPPGERIARLTQLAEAL